MADVGQAAFCTSIVVACEIRYGATKKSSARLTEKVETLLGQLTVLALDTGVDEHYANLRCDLERCGQTIGSNDQFIAAQALALDLTLVTHNVREFSRVPGLRLENWLEDAGG